MSELLSDLRISVRTAWRRRASSGAVVAALGTGIGLASAAVIVAWSVLGQPLPYPEPDRLVVLREQVENGDEARASYSNFADWRDRAGSLQAVTAVSGPTNRTVTGGGVDAPARVPALYVSTDYFAVAGVVPVMGRPLDAGDQVPGAPAAAVVSHDFWARALGSPDDITRVSVTTQDIMNRTSFLVARRTRELGIRTALGATPGRVIRSIQLEALLPALVGVAVGLVVAAAGTGLIRSLLFGIEPVDGPTFAAATVTVGVAACLASWLPARRAAQVDPATALREE